MKISKGDRARIIVRSFFIQGAWNFKGMQNIGFVYAILPGLRAIHGNNYESFKNALKRYFTFFNTQPYMAPTIMGACLHHEAKGDAHRVEELQRTMESSLAAIGDTFFWQDLKPIASLLSLISVMLGHIWGIALAFIAFNVMHIWTMINGFELALKDGIQGVLKLGRKVSAEKSASISYIIPFLVGSSIVLISVYAEGIIPSPWLWLCFFAFLILQLTRVNSFLVFYGMSIIILSLSVLA